MQTVVGGVPRVKPKETGQREHPRSVFSVPFQLRSLDASMSREVHAISVDISEGGVGALVQGHLDVGEAVQIELPLAGRTLSAIAIVRHTSNRRSGFEFLGLGESDRRQITSVVGAA